MPYVLSQQQRSHDEARRHRPAPCVEQVAASLGEDHRSRATTIQLQPDTPTGIDNSEQRTENNGQSVYDLQGRKVNRQWSMVNGQLPKGIYIIRGRKVVK